MVNSTPNSREAIQDRCKRLRYRSWHRGWKETDIILGNFADERLKTLSDELLGLYDQLLDQADVDIWNWLMSPEKPPAHFEPILDIIRAYSPPTP